MQKVNLNKQKEISIEDLKITDHVGFVDIMGEKGYFVYVGKRDHVSAISSSGGAVTCNRSYGDHSENHHDEIKDYFSYLDKGGQPVEMYKFETRKELYKWLSE